jgi:recombination protein RecA
MANVKKIKAELPLTQTEKPKDSSVRRSLIANITKDINKTKGEKVAFNLIEDKDAPTNVAQWISTTSVKLDYIISNRRPGGIPCGRIIEIFGEPSSGKSTLAQTICAQMQRNGGIAVYIDSENATSLENLALIGVNVEELIFVQEQCIEDTFQLIEQIITSVKNQMDDVPILIVWDSVAASVSRTELEATYEQQQIGIKARALSKGIMKVNQILKDKGVTLILLNQTRQKIGVMGSDPTTTPGGMAIPFAASVRLRVYTPSKIKELVDKQEIIRGIEIKIGAVKNKVARPYRQTSIQIIYGKGITDLELLFDDLRVFCESETYKKNRAKFAYKDGLVANIYGTGGWKYIQLIDVQTGEISKEQTFRKDEFETKIYNNSEFREHVLALCDGCFILDAAEKDEITKISSEVDEHALA